MSELGSGHEHGNSLEPRDSGDRNPRRLPGDSSPRERDGGPSAGAEAAKRAAPGDRQPSLEGVELSPHDAEAFAQRLTTYRSGPLPDPRTLQEYEDILPGAAERLFLAYEAVTVKESERDDRVAANVIGNRRIGVWVAAALLAFVVVASVTFFAMGNGTAGVALITAPVVLGLASLITEAIKR